MDPQGAAESDDSTARLLRLRKRLTNVSLARFTCDDFPALMAVLEPYGDPSDEDVKHIERKLGRPVRRRAKAALGVKS